MKGPMNGMKRLVPVLLALLPGMVWAQEHAPDRVIVKRHGQRAAAERVETGNTRQAMEALRQDPTVEYAEPDWIVYADGTPNDTFFPSQWNMSRIGLPAALDLSNGLGAVVGVVDTGVAFHHEDLAGRAWVNPGEIPGNGVDDDANGCVDDVNGCDFYSDDGDPRDEAGHGTHVAGIAGAATNNAKGVAGVAGGARIMALRFLGPCGSGLTSDAVRALHYATEMAQRDGLRLVLNNSWGGGGFSQALQDAIAEAVAAGVVVVVSAGNLSINLDAGCTYFPACYPGVISVASSDQIGDALSSFSNYGQTRVDLAAPGSTSVVSTFLCDKNKVPCYAGLAGTSMAAPHVAGTVALMLARRWMSPEVVESTLRATCRPVAALTTSVLCGGVLDAAAAVGTVPPELGRGRGKPKRGRA